MQLCELFDVALADRTSGPLLLDANGNRLDRHDVDRLLTRHGHRARVLTCPAVDEEGHTFAACTRCRDLTPHVLRASRLTHMHDKGTPIEELQEYVDHADPATTLAYIRRRNQDRTRATHAAGAVDVFEHLLSLFLNLRGAVTLCCLGDSCARTSAEAHRSVLLGPLGRSGGVVHSAGPDGPRRGH